MRLYLTATTLLMALMVFGQNHHGVFITEFMADPTPTIGLPAYEWIEIRNGSGQPVQLQNWRVGTSTALSGPLPFYWLPSDSLLVLCSTSAFPFLSSFGKTLAITSFPSLDNDGTTIWLRHPSGSTIHAVSYDKSWYSNSLKAEGGWSLEMVNPTWPCADKRNWKNSVQARGGSPGSVNSVLDLQTELQLPTALHAYASVPDSLQIQFSAPIDSLWSVRPTLYTLNNTIEVSTVRTIEPLHTMIACKLNRPLLADSIYSLTITGINSCHAPDVGGSATLPTGLAVACKPQDVVINEILFNPRRGGSDFVELLNTSKKVIDLSSLYITNRQTSGVLSNFVRLSATPRLLFPNEHAAFSSEPSLVMQQYLVSSPSRFLQTASFPSLPDEEGRLVLLHQQGDIIDELAYSDNWHFPLLQDKEGVSLERIDPKGKTQWAANWHSAARTEGFATPARKNSQQLTNSESENDFSVQPRLFSPNLDGHDDICTIRYKTEQPGTLVSIQILDAAGRLVRVLAARTLLGRSGQWHWDGRDQYGQLLA
ncbi:MAG: lamin tail domain-containing protein, partial [Sphingomonadales bacterium]